MAISSIPAVSGGTTGQKQQVFTSSGTFTAPTSLTYNGWVTVLCVGGGSGGSLGSYYNGGFGGVVTERIIQIAAGSSTSVTIGAGGTGGTSGTPRGTAGGTTSFSTVSAAGGIQTSSLSQGVMTDNGNGGASPGYWAVTSGSTAIAIRGENGVYGFAGGGAGGKYFTALVNPEYGSSSQPGLGGGKAGGSSTGQAGVTAGSGGGSGGFAYTGGPITYYDGGAGAAGIVIITWYE